MDKKNQTPSKRKQSADILTKKVVKELYEIANSTQSSTELQKQEMCKIIQNTNSIDCVKIKYMLETQEISQNLVNFSIGSALKLMRDNAVNIKTLPKNVSINQPWEIISLCLIKIISSKKQCFDNMIFNEQFLNSMVQKLIQLLLFKPEQLKLKTFNQLFNQKPMISISTSVQISIIKTWNQLLRFYTLVLCLPFIKTQLVLTLTSILQKDTNIKKQFDLHIYKLQNWLSKRQLSFQNIIEILELTINNQNKCNMGYFRAKEYQQTKPKFIDINIHYKCFLPVVLNQLIRLQEEGRQKLIVYIIGKLCFNDSYLLEDVFKLYTFQRHKDVLDIVFKYLKFHYMKSISIKKMKILLQFLRQESSEYKQTQDDLSITKLQKIVGLMSDFSRHHNQSIPSIDFNIQSNITFQKVCVGQQTLVMFIEIIRFQKKMQIISFDLGTKQHQKISISFQIDKNESIKRKIVAVVQNNYKKLFEEDIAYENQNNNQFLLVFKFTSKHIEISINSSYLKIQTEKLPFKKFQNILNIELGKFKRKKGCFEGFHSFKGKLKLFYVFPFIVDHIQLIYGNLTSHYRENLSEFQNMFAIAPTICITKGDNDKNFFNNNKQKKFIPTTLKYSENRDNVFMNKIPSMIDIVQELESYDLFLFLIYHLNQKLGEKSQRMICEIFDMMKNLAISDKKQSCLQWMYQKDNDKQLMGLAHFLRLLFTKERTKRTQSTQISSQKQILLRYVLSFIFYFQQIEKRKKDVQQCQRKKAGYKMLTIEIIVKILLNFDIWGQCSYAVQMRILSQIRKRLKTNKSNDIISMIKDSIIDQNKWVKIRTEFAQNNGFCEYSSNPNRILNGLLIVLFIHNQQSYHKEIQKTYNGSINTSLGMMQSQTSVSTNISQTTPNFSAQNQWMQQVRCEVIDLINMMIQVPNNQQKLQQIYSSQIQLLFQFIIYCNKKQQFRNNSLCYLLLNYIYLSISTDSSPRFNNFFLGKTQSPYYSQSNCLFVAMLMQTIPNNLLESLKLILEIVKQLIIKIEKRITEKSKSNEIKADSHAKRFVRQTIEAYRSRQTQFQPEYMICIFNWIVDNEYGQKKIFALCKAVRSKIKYFSQLKELEDLILKLPSQKLILLTVNPQFMYLLETPNSSPNQKNKICILVNNIYLKIYQTNSIKATEFYNMYLQICYPFSFSQIHSQNHDFPKVFSYADGNDMISVIPTLSTIPKLQGCYNTQLIPVCLKNIYHLGGTFAHYMLKCQVSNSLLQKIDSFCIDSSPKSYNLIDNLIQFFSSDIILFKMLAKEVNDALLEKSLQLVKKHKIQITKNINIFFELYQQITDFIDKISTIYDTDILKNEKRQGLMQGLKKVYCQLNYQIQQKFSKENNQSSLSVFVEKIFSSENIDQFSQIIEENDEQKEDVRDLIKIYSTKDLILANRLYQLNLQHFQTKEQSNIIEPSSNSLKQQVFTNIERIIGYQLDNIDNNSKRAEEEWKRIVGKNQHWIQKGVPKGAIYKVDLHQCPNFYHLNIKVSKTSQKKGYPRRNQFVVQSQCKLDFSRKGSIRNKSKSSISIPNSTHSQQSHTSPKKTIPPIKQQQPKSTFKIIKYYCEYITQKGVYFGKIFYNRYCKQIEFYTVSQNQRQRQRQFIHSTSKYHRLDGPKTKTIMLDELSQIFTRRYILRHTAIQIFTKNKSYFFNLFKRKQRDMFLYEIKDVNKIIDRKKVFNEKQFTKKWLKGQLNNFQYLMILNRYSGRSHNDLSQYPVFPWVISEYSGRNYLEKLRPLDLPIGKLNDERFEGYVLRMKQGGFSEEQKFLYGTFYSNPTVMYNFFIRLQPFITLHWQHQGKKIDHADRLFSGIQQQYSSATTNTSDVKQLIPEFYYWPEFLRNRNQFQLGKKQKGGEVNDIQLPCWANTPQQFIFKMRAALESPQVSQNLHQWIDLIFGIKSIKKNALQNNNLFHPLMYEMQSTQNSQNDIFSTFQDDQDLIVAQLTISQFGQVPEPLFSEPHVQKKGRKGIQIDGCSQSVQYKDAFKLLFYKVDEVSWAVVISKSSAFFVDLYYTELKKNTTQYKLKYESKFNDNQYLHYDYKIINGNNRVISRLINGVLEIFVKQQLRFSKKIQASTYAITSDQKIVYGINNKICKQKIDSRYRGLKQQNKEYLSGHHDRIYKLAINQGIDILLSVDRDNLVLIHYLSSFKFLRQFSLQMAPKEMVKQVRIHDMGYFLFFTTSERILLYTFFGELFVQTDFVSQIETERLTNIQFLSGYEASILLSSTHGYIYMVSWFDIWKQRKMLPYRPFNLKKRKNHHKNEIQCELLHRCQNYDFNDQQLSKTKDTKKQIINFYISNQQIQDSKSTFQYQLVVLYISGKIRIFSERAKRLKTAEGNAILKQMGFY